MWGSHKIQGVSDLAQVYMIQPVLHNTKGGASRLLGVIGPTVPGPYKHELLKVIADVARRYHPGSLPLDGREHLRLVQGRFQASISLTCREARTVMGRLAGGMVLPLPFHSLVLAFCHIVHLCYGFTTLATEAWQVMGLVYTYIVHILPEFAEEGCTATLYIPLSTEATSRGGGELRSGGGRIQLRKIAEKLRKIAENCGKIAEKLRRRKRPSLTLKVQQLWTGGS